LRTLAVRSETLVELGRLKALSDGVVAVALTLLVFDIRLPEGIAADDLSRSLAALGPVLLVYLISFAIIGGAWGSHQRMLGQIRRADGLLVWYTLLSLLPITLLAPCAALLGDFPGEQVAVAVFAADALAIQLTAFLLGRHASRHGLVDAALDPRIVDGIGRRLAVNAFLFALSIPLALLSATLAYGLWIAVFALVFTTDWLSWHQATASTEASIDIDGASHANMHVTHTAGRLSVTAPASDGSLLDGIFGGGLESAVSRDRDRVDVELALPRHRGLLSPRFPWAWGRFSADWDIELTDRIPISLTIDTIGAVAALELEGVSLAALEVQANASSVEIGLPSAAGQTALGVNARAAVVVVRIPDGVAAWIHGDTEMFELDVDVARFPMVVAHREYRSADYSKSRNRVEVSVISSSGSVRILDTGRQRRGSARPSSRSASPTSSPDRPSTGTMDAS
jgi:uncharacterized membrane protein